MDTAGAGCCLGAAWAPIWVLLGCRPPPQQLSNRTLAHSTPHQKTGARMECANVRFGCRCGCG
eukprot:1904072-Lingulodinium_polyedra.AAC.1